MQARVIARLQARLGELDGVVLRLVQAQILDHPLPVLLAEPRVLVQAAEDAERLHDLAPEALRHQLHPAGVRLGRVVVRAQRDDPRLPPALLARRVRRVPHTRAAALRLTTSIEVNLASGVPCTALAPSHRATLWRRGETSPRLERTWGASCVLRGAKQRQVFQQTS